MNAEKQDRLPFAVARSSRATLVEQVVEGLRQCILSGFYKAGDILPTPRELAKMLGVSRIVTRAAVRELTKAGLINPKPGVGCAVLGRNGKLWRGNVLFVSRSNGRTYYVNVFTATLRARLVKAGWLFTQVTVTPEPHGKTDVSELELHLTHPVMLAVVMFDNPDAERILSRSGIPFVTLGNMEKSHRKGCVGHVRYDRAAAATELASAAVAAGVKKAWQVGMEKFDDVGAALKKAAVAVKCFNFSPVSGGRNPEAVSFAVRDAFAVKLAKPRWRLPDLVYFSDDHACTGALAAFAAADIRVPEDVRVATWSNLGNGPVFAKELTRMEMDPEDDAEKAAAAILARLEGDTGAFALTLVPAFRKGKTL